MADGRSCQERREKGTLHRSSDHNGWEGNTFSHDNSRGVHARWCVATQDRFEWHLTSDLCYTVQKLNVGTVNLSTSSASKHMFTSLTKRDLLIRDGDYLMWLHHTLLLTVTLTLSVVSLKARGLKHNLKQKALFLFATLNCKLHSVLVRSMGQWHLVFMVYMVQKKQQELIYWRTPLMGTFCINKVALMVIMFY